MRRLLFAFAVVSYAVAAANLFAAVGSAQSTPQAVIALATLPPSPSPLPSLAPVADVFRDDDGLNSDTAGATHGANHKASDASVLGSVLSIKYVIGDPDASTALILNGAAGEQIVHRGDPAFSSTIRVIEQRDIVLADGRVIPVGISDAASGDAQVPAIANRVVPIEVSTPAVINPATASSPPVLPVQPNGSAVTPGPYVQSRPVQGTVPGAGAPTTLPTPTIIGPYNLPTPPVIRPDAGYTPSPQ